MGCCAGGLCSSVSCATPLRVSSAIRNAESLFAEAGIVSRTLLRQLLLRACVRRLAASTGNFGSVHLVEFPESSLRLGLASQFRIASPQKKIRLLHSGLELQ